MLHKNVDENKGGFRTLNTIELQAISGGSVPDPVIEDDGFTVFGSGDDGWISVSAEDLAALGIFNLSPELAFDSAGLVASMPIPFYDDFKNLLEELAKKIFEAFGYEPINPDHEKGLQQELNDKEIQSQGQITLENGDTWNYVVTADGQTYYDRDGNGDADLKSQYTPFGIKYDTGDGAGWSMPSN